MLYVYEDIHMIYKDLEFQKDLKSICGLKIEGSADYGVFFLM